MKSADKLFDKHRHQQPEDRERLDTEFERVNRSRAALCHKDPPGEITRDQWQQDVEAHRQQQRIPRPQVRQLNA